jgi:hypothetical protein
MGLKRTSKHAGREALADQFRVDRGGNRTFFFFNWITSDERKIHQNIKKTYFKLRAVCH